MGQKFLRVIPKMLLGKKIHSTFNCGTTQSGRCWLVMVSGEWWWWWCLMAKLWDSMWKFKQCLEDSFMVNIHGEEPLDSDWIIGGLSQILQHVQFGIQWCNILSISSQLGSKNQTHTPGIKLVAPQKNNPIILGDGYWWLVLVVPGGKSGERGQCFRFPLWGQCQYIKKYIYIYVNTYVNIYKYICKYVYIYIYLNMIMNIILFGQS